MSKIIEKVVETSKVYAGSTFKLKIKVIRYLTYNELKTKKYDYYTENKIKYSDLKGD